ncbi:DUF2501 domain-containing protein [Sodalis ligni]|uniref:Uncharacterized protein DUF2501 n=1 Tax=Sodalis ligni TaxID=2697027 RepID=A0A4V2Q387_9GAMM|nr:DUF2501 domain-containing protein [Sodalis ligni]QWA10859.1 DUF2501 domain-containing protein [Sodalis ligni]TCL05788.1 uncharacterized protein DUF2501 [Sodalis ligni]
MTITLRRHLLSLALMATLAPGLALAANLMDSVNSALGTSGTTTGNGAAQSGSTASLAGLLGGGDKALSAGTMTNAAGVLEYCAKNNLLSDTGTTAIKDKLMGKLGISSPSNAKSQDYQQGLGGILNTAQGGQLNLKDLGSSQLGQKVKYKACNLVLKQGKNFIS